MYTEIKSYQYVIALLKEYGIRHCVLSAGSRNVPFVHSVEEDPYFKCYSVVDERSAGYFALGLAQELNEPVVISCTASTASCNYWPPVAEAFYQGVPLIILTSDRDPEMLGQREDQMIDQVGMFDRHVKKSVNLPIINNKNDEIYCQRLINEALLELNHNNCTGPVHINVPTNSYNITFNVKELPKVRKIDRISHFSNENEWKKKIEKLKKTQKIAVICGQKNSVSSELNDALHSFSQKYNAVIINDHMSNIDVNESLNSILCMESDFINYDKMKELMPDIVISFGGQVFSGIKTQLKNNYGKFEHWLIQEDGSVIDLFKGLTTIFECRAETFFEYANRESEQLNNKIYYESFERYVNSIKYPEFDYSNVYAIKNVVEKIPEKSILHLSINNSIRVSNYFKINKNIKVYSNIGTYGIDGCMSSFLGQACVDTSKEAFLVIGDLAFFYDMNSLKLNDINKNVHILLINNSGGAEFYYNHTWINESSDKHTTARHNISAKGWVESNGFKYLSARNKEEYDEKLKEFMKCNNEAPVFMEVFTEMKDDAKCIHDFYKLNKPKSIKTTIINKTKQYVKKSFGQEKAKKIIDILKNN